MNELTIVHNPRCTKSRATLALLTGKGLQPTVIDYLSEPPDTGAISRWLDLLGLQPRELMRQEEAAYRDQGLDNPELTRAELIRAMHQYPELIQRPIVIANGKAAIGRPPERVLDIL